MNGILDYIKNECYSLREEPFKLAAGGESRHYFDMRKLSYNPEWLEIVTSYIGYDYLLRNNGPRFVIGGGFGAFPIVFSLSRKLGAYPVLVRPSEKQHGTGGRLVYASQVISSTEYSTESIVVEDVLTTGKSLIDTVRAAQLEGFTVRSAYVLLDREQGGRENIAREIGGTFMVHSLFAAAEVKKMARTDDIQ